MFLCSDDNDTKCSKLLRASLSGKSGFHMRTKMSVLSINKMAPLALQAIRASLLAGVATWRIIILMNGLRLYLFFLLLKDEFSCIIIGELNTINVYD